MRATAHLAALGVIALTAFVAGADDDVTPAQGGAFDPHPLYESLQARKRQLDNEEGDGTLKSVQDGDYGDSVDGYNLPDSYSSAPSYADPSLLSAVMTQADEANFRYPIQTTVPPASDLSASGSEMDAAVSEPETNEINPFELFPPQFHELLEIPLHTYANGSSYSPHTRQQSRPMGPFISKGYANTKIQGGIKVRPQEGQDTPQVAYAPKPVFGDRSEYSVTQDRGSLPTSPILTTSKTTTRTREEITTTKEETTTKTSAKATIIPEITTATTSKTTTPQVTNATSQITNTEAPKRKIYASPPPRNSGRPIITRHPTTNVYQTMPYTKPSYVSSHSSSIDKHDFLIPLEETYPPETSHSTPYQYETDILHEEDLSEYDIQPKIPNNLPPLRYTRRPTTETPTTRYFTTSQSTSQPTVTWTTTTTKPSYFSEVYDIAEQPTPTQLSKGKPYGTRIPPSTLSTNPTVNILSPLPITPVDSESPKEERVTPQPDTTSTTIATPKKEVEIFRPSKSDPYIRPRFPTTTYQPSYPPGHGYFSQDSPEVLPPVMNTFEVSTRPSLQSEIVGRPSPPSLPPRPQPPSLPFPPPLSLAGPPSFPPPHLSTSIPHRSPPSQANGQPTFLPPPPAQPERPITLPSQKVRPALIPPRHERPVSLPPRRERPGLAPPPLPPPPEFLNNEIIPPLPPATFFNSPPSFTRPPPERPTHPPSFRPPTQQAHVPHPRPGVTQFPTSSRPLRVPRPRPHNRPSVRPSIPPPFQNIHPVVTPPPLPHDLPEREPGFTLPAEAGNLPKRPPQHNEIRRNHVENNAPNILPQFRPNAHQNHETFGFQGPSDRVFRPPPPPLRPDKRPAVSKRPSFLENFSFFGRTPVNRRRGETGPRSDINNPTDKAPNKQNMVDKTAGIHYQLTHGPLPKNAQRVVVIGPFKEPPPGAPIIPPPKNNMTPHVNLSMQPPPPPPPLPSRKVAPPPLLNHENFSQELHSSNTGHFARAADRMGPGHLLHQNVPQESENQMNSPAEVPVQKGEKKEAPDVIYGQPSHSGANRRGPSPPNTDPTSQPKFNVIEEVSEEDKEAIVAGKFRFPPMSVDRFGAGDDTALPQNVIPFPVPIVTPEDNSAAKWSIFGFAAPPKPKSPPPVPELVTAEPFQIQGNPLPNASALHSPPPVPSNLLNLKNHQSVPNHGALKEYPSRYSRPASYTHPSQTSDSTNTQQNHLIENNYHNINNTFTTEPSTSPTTPTPKVVTFMPFSVSSVTSKSFNPRPVYRHTTTSTERPPTVTEKTNPTTTTARSVTTPTQSPSTSQPVTPMRITEYPSSNYHTIVNRKETENIGDGGFKAPEISSSAYSGWQAVGAPRLPSTGPGDGLSPVVSYVKENIPDILIKPTSNTNTYQNDNDDDVVTGVISDRMGLVDDSDDGQLVKYSSRFNVETPGIVRSYWVKPPTLA